ncbi:MAG: aromatic-ring-hydroxylating dioxygenase subunit beta [Pigmentiphaga sp.]|uniref:aromatic-ring-hydroxylating dioxygenase subunit beta n=1 Tax=Pigmentiphaga sp. TaxID=1977564 RepID=UPI0029B68DBF|nr:aromatic-ring-hydroxylating dioxygenase subunit beta [Pigmentiphaga sp.]MDX3906079.1 aromatic-ring-hydroxylating dioxygenase subunit beta [Pigmentiphaga sp.]
MNTVTKLAPTGHAGPDLEELRDFVEHEAELLDARRFDEWLDLYCEDAVYWVPAAHGQPDWTSHVSLYYDEKHTMKTRVTRLKHPMIHCQDPPSATVRVLSNFKLESVDDTGAQYCIRSKFIMLEDRMGAERRLFGGHYLHTLRREGGQLRIAQKRVLLTNCDQSFPLLTQPF